MEYTWKSYSDERHTLEEISAFEREMGVVLPKPIKDGHAVSYHASIWKNGKACVGTCETSETASGLFYGLIRLMPRAEIEDYRQEYGERYGVDMSGMIPFGNNGDLFTCLDYRNDPFSPEIWDLYMDVRTPSEGYYRLAHNFDAFLTALVDQDTLLAPEV